MGGRKGMEQIMETEHVEGRDVVVLVEVISLIASVENEDYPEFVSKTPRSCHQAR